MLEKLFIAPKTLLII